MSFDGYNVEYEETFMDFTAQIIKYCITPTLSQTFKFVSELITFNIIFLLLTRFTKEESKFHLISTITGLSYIYLRSYLYSVEALYIIPLVYLSYIIIFVTTNRHFNINTGFSLGTVFISILVAGEFFYYNHDAWLNIRSVVMIAMMKIMSLSFDVGNSIKLPNIWAYSGYIWCPANSVLGPWITYSDYLKGSRPKLKINFKWFRTIFANLLLAFCFVCCSNCINTFIISDENNDFLVFYREASSFRMSHYFISYIASSTMLTAGFTESKDNWSFTITNPLRMELPTSIVSVVVNWNIPIHTFLRKYIFPNFLPYGQFTAVFMTYLVSSMLHGLNVEVSVVLLNLGLFSYVHYKFQDAIANFTNSCVKVRVCKQCTHVNKSQIIIKFSKLLFSFITVIYLMYTGCLMDNIGNTNSTIDILMTINTKWSKVYYIGHITAILCFMFNMYVSVFK